MAEGVGDAGHSGQQAGEAGDPPFSTGSGESAFSLQSVVGHVLRNKAVFVPLVAASFFINLLGYIYPLVFLIIIDKVLSSRGAATLDVLILSLLFFLAFEAVLRYVRHRALRRAVQDIDRSLLSRLIHHALDLPASFYLHNTPVETLSRIEELHGLRRFLTNAVVFVFVDVIFVAVFLALMLNFSVTLSLIILGCVPLYLAPAFLIIPNIQRWTRRSRGTRRESNEAVLDTFNGIETVKGMHAEEPQEAFLTARVGEAVSSGEDSASLRESMIQYNQFVNRFATTGLLWFGASMALEGQLTLGQLVAINIINMRFSQPMMRLCLFAYDVSRLRGLVKEVGSVFKEPTETQSGYPTTLPSFKGGIRFEDVRFCYPGGRGNALEGVSFEIQPGETVGIVGPSGSGKSTISRLIQRLYLPTEGSILLDGADASMVDPAWLRSRIGVVEQDYPIFRRTIAENIALGSVELDMERVVAAAKAACAHEFIIRAAKGYAAKVGARGAFFSVGERQRIALARALFHSRSVLILDEATSSVDQEDEIRFQENLRRLVQGRTVIIIAHRLSALRHADHIISLDQGKIVEQGTPEELARANGYFAHMVRRQTDLIRDLRMSPTERVRSLAGKAPLEAQSG